MIPRQNVEFTKKNVKTQGFGVQQSFYLESFYQNFGSWRSFGGSGGETETEWFLNRMRDLEFMWLWVKIGPGLVLSIHVLGYLILTRPHVL